MENYKWTEKLAVNVQIIDEHHKQLIHLINELRHSIEDNSSTNKILIVMTELAKYTKYHFSTEEEHMTLHNYPNYSSHRKQHDEFIEKVDFFVHQAKNNEENISGDILHFLINWLYSHIRGVDTKFGLFLTENGVAD